MGKQTERQRSVPEWIWHPERSKRKAVRFHKRFILDRRVERLEFKLACTGAVQAELNGKKAGSMQEHPSLATAFFKMEGMPSVLEPGEYTLSIAVTCTEPMPIGPINIHLRERAVGMIAYLHAEGFWLPTDGTWTADGTEAATVCRLGEEPYGDLDGGLEWFVHGGYHDLAVFAETGAVLLTQHRLSAAIEDGTIRIEGVSAVRFSMAYSCNERNLFYHLTKQRHWKELRAQQLQLDLSETPMVTIDLGKERNVRMKAVNLGSEETVLLWNGAESMYELEHYDGCITELLSIPAEGESFTLPAGMRYVRLYVGICSTAPFRLEITFESVNYPLKRIGTIHSDLPLLDRIYEVCAHTNYVCHQLGLWDGIKRDRPNWAYDFYMVAKGDFVLWNDFTVLKRSIAELGLTPYGYWMNSIPSYTLWWVIGLWEYYLHTADREFLLAMKEPLHAQLQWVGEHIAPETGRFLEPPKGTFIEWVPMGEEESWAALNAILRLMHRSVKQLHAYLPELELEKFTHWPDPDLGAACFLQPDHALFTPLIGIVSGVVGEQEALDFLQSYQLKDPITPLSAYWLAECCSRHGLHEKAWDMP